MCCRAGIDRYWRRLLLPLRTIGGDRVIAFNGSGRAPGALSSDFLLEKGITRIERQSPHAVTIPGAVDAWTQLNRDHGRLDLGRLLAPAIAYARDGYPITQRVARDFAGAFEWLDEDAQNGLFP
jgi:gamma-glutamyltranspeptidase/glutathione hydrolase